MIKALESRGVNECIGTWIKNMLENRTVTAKIGDSEASKNINRGTPQGGILSPTIYNIDTDDIIQEINRESPNERHGFAGDIFVIGTGIDKSTVASTLSKDIKRLENWAARNSLAFNVTKTKAINFSRERKPKHPDIIIHGKTIE
jgi:hypothetical protein